MPRPKSPRKAPDAGSCFIRFSPEEFALIKKAMEDQAEGVSGASAISVAAFARDAVMELAISRLTQRELSTTIVAGQFSADQILRRLGLAEEWKYKVVAALRAMASRGEIKQHAWDEFIKPKGR